MNRRYSGNNLSLSLSPSTVYDKGQLSPYHDLNQFHTTTRTIQRSYKNSSHNSSSARRSHSPSLNVVGSSRRKPAGRPSSAMSLDRSQHEVSVEETYINNLQQQVQLLEMELQLQKKLNEEQSKQIR
jgi:hypothetical protein